MLLFSLAVFNINTMDEFDLFQFILVGALSVLGVGYIIFYFTKVILLGWRGSHSIIIYYL